MASSWVAEPTQTWAWPRKQQVQGIKLSCCKGNCNKGLWTNVRIISNKAYKHHLWITGGGSRDLWRLNHPSKHKLCKPLQISGLNYRVERFSREEVLSLSSSFVSHPSWTGDGLWLSYLYVNLPWNMGLLMKQWKNCRGGHLWGQLGCRWWGLEAEQWYLLSPTEAIRMAGSCAPYKPVRNFWRFHLPPHL